MESSTVMIVHQYMRRVLFATTNDQLWRVSNWSLSPLSIPISFQGKFYILEPHTMGSSGRPILQLDPPIYEYGAMSPSFLPPKLIAMCPTSKFRSFTIAECGSDILVAGFDHMPLISTNKLVVYRVADLAKGKIAPVTSIRGNTLFLDINPSMNIKDGDILITRRVFVRAWLTLLSDSYVLDSVDGLLLLQRKKQDTSAILLVHPFTGDFVELPPLMSLVRANLDMSNGRRHVAFSGVTSMSAGSAAKTTKAVQNNFLRAPLFEGRMLVYKVADLIMGKVVPVTSIGGNTFFTTIDHGVCIDDEDISVYVRETIAVSYKAIPTAVGDTIDQQWRVSNSSLSPFSVPISFQGKFYLLEPHTTGSSGRPILELDPPSYEYGVMWPPLLHPKLIATCPTSKFRSCTIAECGSDILVDGFDHMPLISTNKLVVYRVAYLAIGKIATGFSRHVLVRDGVGIDLLSHVSITYSRLQARLHELEEQWGMENLGRKPDEASPWTSLPADLVRLVGWRVLAGDLLDYVRFRAVCTHWRFSTVFPRGRGIVDPRFHPGRWTVLPEGHGLDSDDKGRRRLFSLSTGVSVYPRLPDDYRILDSVDGILLLQRRQRQHDQGSIRLFNPFTSDIVELPPLGSVVSDSKLHLSSHEISTHVVPGGVVTSLTVSSDGAAAVMIWLVELSRVIFATTKDKQWSQSTQRFFWTRRPVSFQGKLYILSYDLPSHAHQVLQMGPPMHEHGTASGLGSPFLPPSQLIATCPTMKISDGIGLAECDSEILVIAYKDSTHTHMVVYRVTDLIVGKVIPVTNIGGKSVFFDTETISIGPDQELALAVVCYISECA
uniref:KIB1-4 beta-propeller domain-containing protein n=1 Tax=Aegilops tauschii TaxID=37682 RepID=M8CJ01_AEGTA